MRQRPTWRRRVQDRVTIPGLIAAGLMVVLIIVLIVIGRTAPSLGTGTNGGPNSSATPIFTPPGVSGVATPASGSASAGSSGAASSSAGATSSGSTQPVTFAPSTPTPPHGTSPPSTPCATSLILPTPCPSSH